MRGSSIALALLGVLWLSAARVEAQADTHRLQWNEDWARVHPAAYVISTVGVAGSLVFDALYQPGPEPRFTGPILFDAPFREALGAAAEEDRERAASASDVLLGALMLWPFVDSLAVVGLGDMNSDVSWQLTMIAAESVAADFILSTIIKLLVHRERPHGLRCTEADRETNPGRCTGGGRTRSFYSGHASAAFNASGMICITHANLSVYGSTAADAFACGAAMTLASIVGILRIIADRHFVSDVLVGSVMGLLTGMLLPWALHYQWDPVTDAEEAAMRVDPLRTAHVPLVAAGF